MGSGGNWIKKEDLKKREKGKKTGKKREDGRGKRRVS